MRVLRICSKPKQLCVCICVSQVTVVGCVCCVYLYIYLSVLVCVKLLITKRSISGVCVCMCESSISGRLCSVSAICIEHVNFSLCFFYKELMVAGVRPISLDVLLNHSLVLLTPHHP